MSLLLTKINKYTKYTRCNIVRTIILLNLTAQVYLSNKKWVYIRSMIVQLWKEACEEVDTCSSKMDLQQNDQNEDTTAMDHLQFDLDMDTITETAVYYSAPRKSLRGRRRKTMDTKSQTQTSLLKSNYNINVEQRVGPKYRPIWPKPYQPSLLSKPKIFGLPSTMNVPALNPASRIIVTTTLPSKEKNQDFTVLEKSSKRTRNYSKSTSGNSNGLKLLTKENGNEKNYSKSTGTLRKDFSFIKTQDRSNKGSIELFFESMAQTVLSLPMHVQAEIKMEICKLVTMAEIKYSSAQSKHGCKID